MSNSIDQSIKILDEIYEKVKKSIIGAYRIQSKWVDVVLNIYHTTGMPPEVVARFKTSPTIEEEIRFTIEDININQDINSIREKTIEEIFIKLSHRIAKKIIEDSKISQII